MASAVDKRVKKWIRVLVVGGVLQGCLAWLWYIESESQEREGGTIRVIRKEI